MTSTLPSYIVDTTQSDGPCTVFYQDEQARAEGGKVQTRHATRDGAVRHITKVLAVRYDGPFTVVSGHHA